MSLQACGDPYEHTDWLVEKAHNRVNEKLTAEEFTQRFGFEPENDDLDRVNCSDAGLSGHWSCGICSVHNKPRFVCGCMIDKQPDFNNDGELWITKRS